MVIEASRPRALAALGVHPDHGPAVWVSITGHGRAHSPERVGFGDDAAVAGGLIDGSPDDPRFLGDAVADPLTGLRAAAHVLEALASGQRTSLDVSLAATAAWANGLRREAVATLPR